MLGPPKPRRLDEPIAVSLEELVPPDHFYRHLQATLDLGFVRDWTRELYADRGRPSIDPVIFFKLQLVMFFEGIRSERQLIEIAIANTPARSAADSFPLSASQSTASSPLHRGDRTLFPPNRRT